MRLIIYITWFVFGMTFAILLPRLMKEGYKLVKARVSMAGVKHFSPHDFRRTFCSYLLEEGEDVFTVQEVVGHASPATTARYDRRGEGRKRRAVKRLKSR